MKLDRERARVFGGLAEAYDRARPRYPDALIDAVLGPAPAGLSVLDVACGTGIASRQMAERGARVLGVDLNAGMAAVAARHGIAVEVAPFETWDARGRTFDRVTCAQAWHWLDAVVSVDKTAALVRPGGRLCLFWSVGHHPDALAGALQAAYQRVLPPETGRLVVGYAANEARDPVADLAGVADALRACDALAAPEIASFPWSREYTRAEWLDELATHSDHAALPPELRQRLFDEIARTIDGFGGRFPMPYVSVLVSAARR